MSCGRLARLREVVARLRELSEWDLQGIAAHYLMAAYMLSLNPTAKLNRDQVIQMDQWLGVYERGNDG